MFCTFSNGNLSKVSRFKLKSVNQISDPYVIIGRITELYNFIQALTENLSDRDILDFNE